MKKTILFMMIVLLIPAGCEVKEEVTSRTLDLPHFMQTDSGNCLQTNVKMQLKYYFPEKEFSLEELDELTGRTIGKWTWTSQVLPLMIEQGLDAYYYSTTPYNAIGEGKTDFLLEHYGEEDGIIMDEHTNWDSLLKSIEKLNETGRFFEKKLSFEEVEEEFNKHSTVILLIDSSVLHDLGEDYSGHFISLTGINETDVVFNNPAGEKNEVVEKEKIIAAWNAAGTDNDVIIIKEKI